MSSTPSITSKPVSTLASSRQSVTMWTKALRFISLLIIIISHYAEAFVPSRLPFRTATTAKITSFEKREKILEAVDHRRPSHLSMTVSDDPGSALSSMLSSASIHLSTIDSDIANISNDEFGTVFAGGIVVMFGGILSALIVGAILDVRGNYDDVLGLRPENMDLNEDDVEGFMQKLSPDEREKAEVALDQLRASKEKKMATVGSRPEKRDSSLFSDYD